MSITLSQQASGNSQFRVEPDALLLTAACVWLINGLHARPEDGPAARSLMRATLPLTEASGADPGLLPYPASTAEEEEEEESGEEGEDSPGPVPYIPYGVIFLRRIMIHGAILRMRKGGPFLNVAAFHFFFNGTIDDIKHKYRKLGIIPREQLALPRNNTNRSTRTATYISTSDEPEELLFNLEAAGHRLPPPPVDSGSDVSDTEAADGAEATFGSIDASISQMWRQFLIDLSLKAPTPRGANKPSYLKLSKAERMDVNDSLYKNKCLSDMWNACQWKVGSKDDWDRTFNHLFPPRGHQTAGNVQNYTQCQYYTKWKEICEYTEAPTVNAIRRALRAKMDEFYWMPHACQDKLWVTTQVSSKGFRRLPPGSTGPAPQIIVRRREPRWNVGVVSDDST